MHNLNISIQIILYVIERCKRKKVLKNQIKKNVNRKKTDRIFSCALLYLFFHIHFISEK